MVAFKEREALIDMAYNVELICVGNELLIGKTPNTNAVWIAKKTTELGVKVRRITVVMDEVEEISRSVLDALKRRAHLIVVTGGLGPTFDDKTLEGISKALKRPLVQDPLAFKMVSDKYHSAVEKGIISEFKMTAARLKMAHLPLGAVPLPNLVGTAPGVRVSIDGTEIVALPGVPKEMKAIFSRSVASIIKEGAQQLFFQERSLVVTDIVESQLAPMVEQVMSENEGVYIKSHPKGEEGKARVELHFSTWTGDKDKAERIVEKACSDMLSAMGKLRANEGRR